MLSLPWIQSRTHKPPQQIYHNRETYHQRHLKRRRQMYRQLRRQLRVNQRHLKRLSRQSTRYSIKQSIQREIVMTRRQYHRIKYLRHEHKKCHRQHYQQYPNTKQHPSKHIKMRPERHRISFIFSHRNISVFLWSCYTPRYSSSMPFPSASNHPPNRLHCPDLLTFRHYYLPFAYPLHRRPHH